MKTRGRRRADLVGRRAAGHQGDACQPADAPAAVAEPACCSIAMGRRHTREFQRRWADRYPDVELNLIRTNSPTGGLAEGLCDIAVLRTAVDAKRFARRPAADEGYPRHR